MQSAEAPVRTDADTPNQHNTDSMVTVPLSEPQSTTETTHPDWPSFESPRTPVEPFSLSDQLSDTEDPVKTTPTQNDVRRSNPEDVASVRSRSSETDQTEDSDGECVDWAELDKTEEQEHRGDGDEVCQYVSTKDGN